MKRNKKFIAMLMAAIMMLGNVNTVLAAENDSNLTPMEIDEILKDVEPVEIEKGVYLRDNGNVSMLDIDVSQFESVPMQANCTEAGNIISDNSSGIMPYSWDLSTPYIASFSAKYRVLSGESFTGYDTIYVQCYDVVCPSVSAWKTAIYIGWDEQASSAWLNSSTTTYTSKYYNLDKSKAYKAAFVKTDDKLEASGVLKVYVK